MLRQLGSPDSPMTTFSVYDYATKSFQYFQAPGTRQRGQRAARGNGLHGLVPESLLAELPHNAVSVGFGDVPRGVMALPRGVSLGEVSSEERPSSMMTAIVWAIPVTALAAWFYQLNWPKGRKYRRRRS